MSAAAPSPSGVGLQVERTGLAWSRTSLGVAANAALLAVRELGHGSPGFTLVPASLAVVVAVATAVYGRRRTARLRRGRLPSPLAARFAIPLLGGSVVVLGVLCGAVAIL